MGCDLDLLMPWGWVAVCSSRSDVGLRWWTGFPYTCACLRWFPALISVEYLCLPSSHVCFQHTRCMHTLLLKLDAAIPSHTHALYGPAACKQTRVHGCTQWGQRRSCVAVGNNSDTAAYAQFDVPIMQCHAVLITTRRGSATQCREYNHVPDKRC